ncbi:hypothetical protein AK812_SmicGene40506 [Symbiodinium microadriaticum]|uniref:Uncharacterized protein n=1 Tax=Symbiodinium microadriaticum TaxID=2951 RepID=A0A1Q9C8I7_SYMMI|nr:hypothetical protein AK812_SmicGene40506 [Symbiodinium microadriaticum]CAE7343607.1 unnamed protein product [Symbiodinium microadriaticum]
MFLRQLVVPVAVWGTWFVHGAASTWRQLQQRLLGVLYDGGKYPASPDLIALLQGHSLDFQFMADYQTISMWAKLVQLGRARWQPSAMRGRPEAMHQLCFGKHGDLNALLRGRRGSCGMPPVPKAVQYLPLQWSAQHDARPIKVELLCSGREGYDWCCYPNISVYGEGWDRRRRQERLMLLSALRGSKRGRWLSPAPPLEMMDAPDEQERVRELRELGGRAPTTPPMSTLLEKKSGGRWNKAPRPSDTRTEQTGLHRGHRPDLVLRLARLARPGAEPSNHLRPSTGISFTGGVLEWLANYEASITRQSLIDVTTGSQGGAPRRESSRADCPIHGGTSCDQGKFDKGGGHKGSGRLAQVATRNISAWTGLAAVVTAPVLLSVQRGSMEVVEETLAAIAHQSAGLVEGVGAEAARAVQVAGAAASVIVLLCSALR